MEFGIIVQSYLPKFWREGKPNAEHEEGAKR